MKKFPFILLCLLLLPAPAAIATPTTVFTADVWADNWFAMYVNGKLVGQDSIPITTVKSFNKESFEFTASYPLTISIIAKDYVENASGLEYIGQPNQQIGDGGIIAQIHEKVSGKFVSGTDATWKSKVINTAPLNIDCEKSIDPLKTCKSMTLAYPKSWNSVTYKDTSWSTASEYSESEVGVKEGYLQVQWDGSAKLIWSKSLKLDNVILFRKLVKAAPSNPFSVNLKNAQGNNFPVEYTCDGAGALPQVTWNNIPTAAKSLAITLETIPGPPRNGEPVAKLHYLLINYNIDPVKPELVSSKFGTNFQGRNSYAPPCSQGPGSKTYTLRAYAFNSFITDVNSLSGNLIEQFAKSQTIASFQSDFIYARK